MKKIYIEGRLCVGPTFSKTEFLLIKRNFAEQRGLATLADALGVIGNSQRLGILYLLHAHKEMCVCDLGEVLGLTPSALSQHLRKLKDKNMVKTRRKGQTIYYSVAENLFTAQLRELFGRNQIKEQHAFVFSETE